MLLFKTSRGGDAGVRNLKQRIRLFDNGDWGQVFPLSEITITKKTGSPSTMDLSAKLKRAVQLAEIGELSHAARELQSVGLAPGTSDTFAQLTNPQLRPAAPAEPFISTPRVSALI